MAIYSGEQLRGAGITGSALTSGSSYNFSFTSSISGSANFTLEAVRNDIGFYDSSSNTIKGDFDNFNGTQGLVSSSYISSVIINQGGGSFDFTPSTSILQGKYFLRGEGIDILNLTNSIIGVGYLLLQDGGFLLQEIGDKIIL